MLHLPHLTCPSLSFIGSLHTFAFFMKFKWGLFGVVATVFRQKLGRKNWTLHLHLCQHVSFHHQLFYETERQPQLSYSTHPSSCWDLFQAAHNRCVCVCEHEGVSVSVCVVYMRDMPARLVMT